MLDTYHACMQQWLASLVGHCLVFFGPSHFPPAHYALQWLHGTGTPLCLCTIVDYYQTLIDAESLPCVEGHGGANQGLWDV